jgi:transcription initiation factor IIE alpha subunit
MDTATFQQIMQELESLVERTDGLQMSELLDVSPDLRELITWMIRKKRFQDEDIAEYLGLGFPRARKLILMLMFKGFIAEADQEEGQYHTQIKVSPRYRVPKNVLNLFDE